MIYDNLKNTQIWDAFFDFADPQLYTIFYHTQDKSKKNFQNNITAYEVPFESYTAKNMSFLKVKIEMLRYALLDP